MSSSFLLQYFACILDIVAQNTVCLHGSYQRKSNRKLRRETKSRSLLPLFSHRKHQGPKSMFKMLATRMRPVLSIARLQTCDNSNCRE
jgi:hypothetical protein